jgi:hypothetical protein
MTVAGGTHLMAGTGTFSTTLTLTLVAANGSIISTNNNVPVSFVVNFSNSCSGVTLNSYFNNQYTFSNYASQMAGATITDAVSIQYAPGASACSGWSLKVRALGAFVNGSNSVHPQYLSLRFNRVSTGTPTAVQIGVSNNPVALSYTDVALISNSAKGFTPHTNTEHKFDLIIAGGNHLLVPNGTYKANLMFTLYNQNNEVVNTRTQEMSFQINSNTNSFTVELQNSANVVDMLFNTISDYSNGVSVTKIGGLKVTGYSPHQILIKAGSVNLEGTNDAIPVGVVNVQTTLYSTITGTINTHTRTLSTADQIIITNPLANYTQQSVEYTLRYYTNGGDNRLLGKSGTFNTTVLFVTVPQ